MHIIEQSELTSAQKNRIVELWNAEYPENLAFSKVAKFDDYLSERPHQKHFLLVSAADEIVGWACVFERESSRWFAIIIDGTQQGKGLGVKLIDALKAAENQLFGWVIDHSDSRKSNGETYQSPLDFYRKIGFTVHEGERIEKDGISGVKIEWKK